MPDLTETRRIAMAHAVELHSAALEYDDPDGTALGRKVRGTATQIYDWLVGPASLHITIGPVHDADGQPYPNDPGGQPVQLRITDQDGRPYRANLTVEVFDAVGNRITDDPGTTTDDLAWTLDTGEGVVTTAVSGDTRTCTVTAASIGSSVVRVSLGELTGTVAVDVIPGDAAELRITESTPEPAPDTGEPIPGDTF